MDQAFHVPWERNNSIRHFCTRPAYPVIQCTTNEPTKGWNLKTRMIFTGSGLIDEKTNLNKNLSTNKTYIRLRNDDDEDIDEEIGVIESITDSNPIPGDDEVAWEWE